MKQIARRASVAAAVACLAGCAAHPAAGNHVQVTGSTAPTPTLGTQSLAITFNNAATSTALTLSSAQVGYGHERAERLTVTVPPQYPWTGTPGGKVTIKTGLTTICTITLTSGKGSCALTARKLPVGTYTLVAAYRGSPDFASSISPRKTLKVVK